MHEMAVVEEIVDIVERACDGGRASRLVLEIGKLSGVLPDAVRFCFDMVREGTPLAGATLEIIETPGRARCRGCGAELALDRPFGRCVCSCTDLEWTGGTELRIKTLEVQ